MLVVDQRLFGAKFRNRDLIRVVPGLLCELNNLRCYTSLGCGASLLEENVAIANTTVGEMSFERSATIISSSMNLHITFGLPVRLCSNSIFSWYEYNSLQSATLALAIKPFR
jgi:hypothetical protein